ncbi:MAG TPA: bifunctional metallophosphatase/5'-nucleotidase [Intrasporangium sp.]|uniref:bifunctional metallophosphatase/5'-nucleotidase n=1 Tax=Intrasporangium sp. TaxID=1925024 RepID=UPI002B474963|nr:bifunctional metallophosphatase/5'-nucleotidase [Intrasporangium sp.]HKX65619.1 bifunctional metallophosphatase/5'-nucleotidase [Intrasporangium sp.]
MTYRISRVVAVGAAALLGATALAVSPAQATNDNDKPNPSANMSVQLLSFNDYHGRIKADGDAGSIEGVDAGGAEYLSAKLTELRAGHKNTLTVAAGDLIGGSTFISGLFHDEPSVETLNAMGLSVSSVGNHEFDEGTTELLRMQNGGCHPTDGCYFPDEPYAGADFQYLAANVVRKDNGETLLPATSVKKLNGVDVGFIGMTLEATDTLVSPKGVASVDFLDEVETANKQADALKKQGVEAIVVLLHEGGYQEGTINECEGISDPIAQIAAQLDPEIDAVITGHTHQAYICQLPDPDGVDRLVTSAASYGRVVTETELVINRRTKDVVRDASAATNHIVERAALTPDPAQTAIVEKWDEIAAPLAAEVVGTVKEDITGDSGGNRGIETPMADLVADAILWGTNDPDEGGAQLSLMNVGGVRGSFIYDAIKAGEQPGEITYSEAYAVAPFGNLLVSMDLTGAQLKTVLEQQYQPVEDRGSRPMLALGVSEGFTYEWDASQPQGSRVVLGSMYLNGVQMDMNATYRVSTLNFLADGGDLFTGFLAGTNVVGGPEDLANLVAFLKANPGLTAPDSRIAGL